MTANSSLDTQIWENTHYYLLYEPFHWYLMKGCSYFDLYCTCCHRSLYTHGYECFYQVKCYVDFHRASHMSSMTNPMTLHSSPIHVLLLDRKALENNPHIGRFGRLKCQVISKPGWLTNWMGVQNVISWFQYQKVPVQLLAIPSNDVLQAVVSTWKIVRNTHNEKCPRIQLLN